MNTKDDYEENWVYMQGDFSVGRLEFCLIPI